MFIYFIYIYIGLYILYRFIYVYICLYIIYVFIFYICLYIYALGNVAISVNLTSVFSYGPYSEHYKY